MTAKETERLVIVETKLDYIQEDIAQIKKLLEGDYVKTKESLKKTQAEVEELKETVRPFTQFRRKLWGYLVTATLTSAILAILYYEINKFKG